MPMVVVDRGHETVSPFSQPLRDDHREVVSARFGAPTPHPLPDPFGFAPDTGAVRLPGCPG
ncbi:hypothetical protein [Streptomyces mayteni]